MPGRALPRPNGAPPPDLVVTADLVRELLGTQCPALAHLPLREVEGGWDNAIFRVGDRHVARLPVRASAAELIANEALWGAVVSDGLQVATPVPVHVGHPTSRYPWTWSVAGWIDGEPVEDLPVTQRIGLVDDLADALCTIHRPAPEDAPRSRFRGIRLSERGTGREAILRAWGPRSPLVEIWDRGLEASAYAGPPLWLHGDIHPLNLLQRGDVLVGIIDFGDVNAGDPASDLSCAWWLFGPAARRRFRERLDESGRYDDAVWVRAAAWAAMFASIMPPGTSLHPSATRMAADLAAEFAAG